MTAKLVNKSICRKTQGIAEEGNTCLQTPGTCESCPDWANRSKPVSQKVYIPNGNPAIGVGQAVESLGIYTFTVPLTPPSVNMYVRHTRQGRHYVTGPAEAFKLAVAIVCRGKSLCLGKTCSELRKLTYTLEATVYFGPKQKGDGDNLWKCLADALKECAVIHSDAAVKDWIMHVRRDNANPRTEITIEAHQ